MLRSLVIGNVALIERLELALGPGLNVFTGETGAGKSILLDAFALVLGGRAETSLIRSGEPKARVEALFDAGDHPGVSAYLEAHGLPVHEELVVVRELSREARNRCWVNGSLTTRRTLEGLGDLLVDLHGQHDHQLLLRCATHLGLVDDFGPKAHGERLARVRALVAEYRLVRARLERGDEDERARTVEREHLDFQIREIEEARLGPGEDEQLHDELRLLSGAESIREDLALALRLLDGDGEGEGGGVDALRGAAARLGRSGAVGELATRLEALSDEAQEVRGEVESMLDTVRIDPERLAEVEARMGVVHRLTRKYGRDVAAVLATLDELVARRQGLAQESQLGEEDEARRQELEAQLVRELPELSRERARQAARLGAAIQEQIRDLAMPEATVAVRLVREPDPAGLALEGERFRLHGDGLERAEIMVSTNPGEPPGPLARIASGGELSRVMLGLKAAMARLEVVPIMVFDEIDAGVGGETGKRMAEKLRTVSERCQCLCVTHLPSVAAAGTRQFQVSKSVDKGRTRVHVEVVEGDARERELARMLGAGESREGLELARDLLGLGADRRPAAKGRRAAARRGR